MVTVTVFPDARQAACCFAASVHHGLYRSSCGSCTATMLTSCQFLEGTCEEQLCDLEILNSRLAKHVMFTAAKPRCIDPLGSIHD